MAAVTEKPLEAKLHMKACLILFVFEGFLAIRAVVGTPRLMTFYLIQFLFVAFCFKVKRRERSKLTVPS